MPKHPIPPGVHLNCSALFTIWGICLSNDEIVCTILVFNVVQSVLCLRTCSFNIRYAYTAVVKLLWAFSLYYTDETYIMQAFTVSNP